MMENLLFMPTTARRRVSMLNLRRVMNDKTIYLAPILSAYTNRNTSLDLRLWAPMTIVDASRQVSPFHFYSLYYCIGRNFRQRKISSKATVRQFVRNLFSSNVGRRLLLFGHSVVALLLIVYLHIHKYFWSHTCSFVKNLVRILI